MQGGCKMRIVMQDEKCLRKVTFVGGGDISTWGHARWIRGEMRIEKSSLIHLM